MITFGSPQALEILAKQRILERWQGYDNHPFFVIMVHCDDKLPSQLIKAQAEVEKWLNRVDGAEQYGETKEVIEELEGEYSAAIGKLEKVVTEIFKNLPQDAKQEVEDYLGIYLADDMRQAKIAYRELLEQYKKG